MRRRYGYEPTKWWEVVLGFAFIAASVLLMPVVFHCLTPAVDWLGRWYAYWGVR